MRRLVAAFLASSLLGCAAVRSEDAPAAQPPIRLTNYAEGETIRYPVPLLCGALADAEERNVQVTNTSSTRDTKEMQGLAHKGRFKILAELVPGPNKLLIRCGKNELPLTLVYKPQTNPHFVRMIYITDNTGNTDYQTPLEKDPQDYAGKFDTMMKLLQTFTAERLNDLGFGRQTFNLELDEQGKVKVHVFKCPAPAETYYKMGDQAWYANIAGLLEKKFPTRMGKNLVVAAYTRFDPETKKVRGHTALGGGGLALFGSGDVFTWPGKLADAQPAFMNATPIDPAKVFSDSVGRHTYWGAASTTIGACLHELCHTFGLPHSREGMDIMTRGIDQFNRAFTFVDPPSGHSKKPVEFPSGRVACFPPVSAAALAPCRWFALDEKQYNETPHTGIGLNEQGDIEIASDTAIRYVGFGVKGDAVYHVVPPLEQAKRFTIPLADVRKRTKTDEFNLWTIDDQGHFKQESAKGLLSGPFVRTWQFAKLTEPWPDKNAFVKLDEKRLAEITASAATAKAAGSGGNFVDFLPRFPGDKQEDVAGYAYRIVKCAAPRKARILTGSDDALRVWLNGKLIQEALKLRGASPDEEACVAEFRAGDNALLVEVSQGLGGWGLYLRLEDAGGRKLRLDDNGELTEVAPPK